MKIYLLNTCSAFDYKHDITVTEYKTKVNCLIIEHRGKELHIPMSNIICLEENA